VEILPEKSISSKYVPRM